MAPVLGSRAHEWAQVEFGFYLGGAGGDTGHVGPLLTQGDQELSSTLGWWAPAVACSPQGEMAGGTGMDVIRGREGN